MPSSNKVTWAQTHVVEIHEWATVGELKNMLANFADDLVIWDVHGYNADPNDQRDHSYVELRIRDRLRGMGGKA